MGIILALLGKVPIWAYALAGLFVWGAYGHHEAKEFEKAKQATIIAAQQEKAKLEADSRTAEQKVEVTYGQKLQAVNVTVVKLRTANNKLQQLLQQSASAPRSSATICGPDGERGRNLESLLAEGSGLATEGDERVEYLTAKVGSLQDYINKVCLGK